MLDPSRERFSEQSSKSVEDLLVEYARYLPVRKLVKGKRILDLGCGAGYSSNLLKEWGASHVTGVDVDLTAIELARDSYASVNLNFIQGYAEQVSNLVDLSTFDGVCFVETLEHLYEPELVLRQLNQGCNGKAWIYITVPNDFWNYKYTQNDNPYHLAKYTKDDFLTVTQNSLGIAREVGEAHAFLGFSTKPDSLYSGAKPELSDALIFDDIDSQTNSNDCLFYYALWNAVQNESTAVGSINSMEIYTLLKDRSNLSLSTLEINNATIRELANKLQATTEALIEERNRNLSLSTILKELTRDESREDKSVLVKKLYPLLDGPKKLGVKGIFINPPNLLLKVYKLLPSRTKDSLRKIRRRLMS